MNGQPIQQNQRYLMIADAVFSHLAHHRGQLTVYLRLNEAKVPELYGPPADEHFLAVRRQRQDSTQIPSIRPAHLLHSQP